MWYEDPAWHAIIISFVALILSTYLTWRTFKVTHEVSSTYTCDSHFLEIAKLFISDPSLYPFYRLGPEMTVYWDSLSDEDKKLYLLAEIHYFHLAFTHHEYKEGRVEKNYWKLYENWLNELVNYSPMFLEVHKREADNFEKEFAELVAGMKANSDA